MKIGDFQITRDGLPYVIAEIGVNHENDMALARRMIREVAEAGGHAVKFQTYKAERLASRHSPAYWDRSKEPAESQFALFKKHDHFGPDEYGELARFAGDQGVHFMSTPFDLQAVELLAPWVPAFKIASADINNLPLLEAVAAQHKPVILSTGASTQEEVDAAVEFLARRDVSEIALLHCVLSYPTAPEDANLAVISTLARTFPEHTVGYSDHVPPEPEMLTLAASYLLGARIIEKHYTFDKSRPGNDHYHAMDQQNLVVALRRFDHLRTLCGRSDKRVLAVEEDARKYARRSLVAASDLPRGHRIARGDLAIKRPGTGIAPTELERVIGRSLAVAIGEDEILTEEHLAKD